MSYKGFSTVFLFIWQTYCQEGPQACRHLENLCEKYGLNLFQVFIFMLNWSFSFCVQTLNLGLGRWYPVTGVGESCDMSLSILKCLPNCISTTQYSQLFVLTGWAKVKWSVTRRVFFRNIRMSWSCMKLVVFSVTYWLTWRQFIEML